MNNFYLSKSSNLPREEQIISSKITARATIRIPGVDGVIIVAAFQLSHELSFWFVFKAKTCRSPRRLWKAIRRAGARVTFPNVKTTTLDDMVKSIIGSASNVKVSKRYPIGKRVFVDRLNRAANPFQQTPVAPLPGNLKADLVNARNGWTRRRSIFG